MSISTETADEYKLTFESLEDLAEAAERHIETYLNGRALRSSWNGVNSMSEALRLARDGWMAESRYALDVAEQAVEKIEREHDVPMFHPLWDVSGCEVDVGRYLAGEPENMIDYEVAPTTKSGRVIAICATVVHSCAIETETIKQRGYAVVALALTLSKLGYAIELWAEYTSGRRGGACFRVLVKGASDELDEAKIMFAYAHPAMSRALMLPAMHEMPNAWWRKTGTNPAYGPIAKPRKDLPKGTIYLPGIVSHQDVPDADEMVVGYMRELGILVD